MMKIQRHKKTLIPIFCSFITLLLLLPFMAPAQQINFRPDDELVTNLPIIIIDTYGQEIPDEPKINAEMGIIYNGPGQMNHQNDPFNNYDGFVGIEMRGQSSQFFYPKKSYGFETRDEEGENLNVSLLGLPAENDWVLYAPYGDKSMLRNVVTFFMARSIGGYASETIFCELILNGEYMGVYVLMERIKRDKNRVDIASLNPDEISGDDLTGGYIVRVDKVDPDFQIGPDGWLSAPNPSFPDAKDIIFQYFYPKASDIVPEQRDYISNYISLAEEALIGSSFSNPDLGYNAWFDTPSFVDHLLLNEISKEVDKYRYSTYFFKDKDSKGGKLFSGPAWDFNLGYANVDYWPPGISYSGWNYPVVEPYEWGIMYWWKRLMQDSYFRNLAKTRYHQLRQDELSNERLELFVDSITSYIHEAQERNYERWPILGTWVWPNYDWENNTYEDEVAFFETWLYNRLEWMDNNFSGVVLNPAANLFISGDYLEITLTDDYFSRSILDKEYFILNGNTGSSSIDSVVYQDAATAIVYLSAMPPESLEISVTIHADVINSWENLTTNTAAVGIHSSAEILNPVKVYAAGGKIYLMCNQPELLDEEINIFNLMGQLVQSANTYPAFSSGIETNLTTGIYLATFRYDGKMQTSRILINN
jgi:hypothetical protein